MNDDAPLSPQETELFQALVKPGIVYLLMLRLDRPTGAREIADILGIHEQTAAKYLHELARLNLVARSSRKNGYVLTRGPQQVREEGDQLSSYPRLESITAAHPTNDDFTPPEISQNSSGPSKKPQYPRQPVKRSQYPEKISTSKISGYRSHTVKKSHSQARTVRKSKYPPHFDTPKISQNAPHTVKISQNSPRTVKNSQYPVNMITTTGIKLIKYIKDPVVVVDFKGKNASKNSRNRDGTRYSGVWEELFAAGIGANQRTQALARLPHVTPEFVRAHRLKLEEGGKSGPKWTGLLVTILERGDPAPELNPSGHLASCKCMECHRYAMAKSWGDFQSAAVHA